MNNNQRYSFHPHPTDPVHGGELRLIVVTHGAISLAHAHALAHDLRAAVDGLAQLAQCDALEIDPCVGLDANGTVTSYMDADGMERYPASDAGACAPDIACWTVYGHLTTGGAISLLDYPSRHEADGAAGLLRPFLRAAAR